ncbi:MAG: PucR family transcriptional regulator [Candidatus Dormibacteria bacterium]
MRVLASLAQALCDRLPQISDRTVAAICEREDGYREGRLIPLTELRRSVHDSLQEYLAALTRMPEDREPSRDQAWATGRSRAELGVPLESVLRAYRLGGSVIWDALLEEARSRPVPPTDELMEAAVLVWEMTDELSAAVGQAYRHSEAGILSRDKTRRQGLLQGLFTGMAIERDLIFAAESLNLPERGPYMVAVAEPVLESVDAVARSLLAGGIRSEWVRQEERLAGLLALGSGGIGAVKRSLETMAPLRVGLSPVVATLGEVGIAYRQAELAVRAIPPHRHQVASLDERLPSALLVASPELAQRLAHRVFGAILELPAGERGLLLRTLRSYIDCGGSVGEVAERFPCHRNTVFNRLVRIRELTGLNPSLPRDSAELVLALDAIDLLGI